MSLILGQSKGVPSWYKTQISCQAFQSDGGQSLPESQGMAGPLNLFPSNLGYMDTMGHPTPRLQQA